MKRSIRVIVMLLAVIFFWGHQEFGYFNVFKAPTDHEKQLKSQRNSRLMDCKGGIIILSNSLYGFYLIEFTNKKQSSHE